MSFSMRFSWTALAQRPPRGSLLGSLRGADAGPMERLFPKISKMKTYKSGTNIIIWHQHKNLAAKNIRLIQNKKRFLKVNEKVSRPMRIFQGQWEPYCCLPGQWESDPARPLPETTQLDPLKRPTNPNGILLESWGSPFFLIGSIWQEDPSLNYSTAYIYIYIYI